MDDASTASLMIDRGVDNLITNDSGDNRAGFAGSAGAEQHGADPAEVSQSIFGLRSVRRDPAMPGRRPKDAMVGRARRPSALGTHLKFTTVWCTLYRESHADCTKTLATRCDPVHC